MKGPVERLKYDLRRVWECPLCHHKERTDGTVTTLVCRCQASKEPLQQVVMKLIDDRIQRRLPVFVPPTDDQQPKAATVTSLPEEAKSSEAITVDDAPRQ